MTQPDTTYSVDFSLFLETHTCLHLLAPGYSRLLPSCHHWLPLKGIFFIPVLEPRSSLFSVHSHIIMEHIVWNFLRNNAQEVKTLRLCVVGRVIIILVGNISQHIYL